ncbi:transporter substrate-binding domain-containing protein [Hydrogenophaga sp. 2FB]|uniref:transporter substrate-binding domain-containing protein n=1 Tax=Hydrogenophaga sp. 2FB TaxID=2502187 RepID=UPI0010F65419|nr:transporter substrate-binding domain-containing protein [Hydrogenophaga sp. 2FB]
MSESQVQWQHILPEIGAEEIERLAPSRTLRIGVYSGSPTSFVSGPQGEKAGIAWELGHRLGRWLDVPVMEVQFTRVAEIVEALTRSEVDFTFTNATARRASIVAFTEPLLSLELGYLVRSSGDVISSDRIDQPGVCVGVSEGSSSQIALGKAFKHARVIPVESLGMAARMLKDGRLHAFATNKGILNELADTVGGSRVLDDRWGLEHMAIAVPKGREAGLPLLNLYAQAVRCNGVLSGAIRRSGLRGVFGT